MIEIIKNLEVFWFDKNSAKFRKGLKYLIELFVLYNIFSAFLLKFPVTKLNWHFFQQFPQLQKFWK